MKITDSVCRLDSQEKIAGQTKYIEDVSFEGMQYAKTLRSAIVCGEIAAIDYPDPPPGITVVDASDVLMANEVAMILNDMPIFADRKVTYFGEPIALIVGQDKDAVLDYLSAIRVHYLEKPAIVSIEAALKEAKTDPSAILSQHAYGRGSFEDLDWDMTFERAYETGYQEQLYMEKQGVVATYQEGVITVYGSLQCPYYVLNALKHATGLNETQLRVVQSPTGGAFGGKEEYPSLLACQVAMAAKKVGAPVQLVMDRREDMAFTTKRHPSKILLKSYVKDDHVVGVDCNIQLDAGSYIGLSDVVLQRAMLTLMGCYQIPVLRVAGQTLRTNNVFAGAFRGFGAPQSMFALELHMHQLATALNKDPVAFKRAHYVHQGERTSTGGIFNEPIYLEALTDQLMALSDYEVRRAQKGPNEGYGFAIIPHGGGFTGDGEATHIKATVKLRCDRAQEGYTVTILVSNVEMGQGALTALTKIVAATLEIPMERVFYQNPDTFVSPDSGPTVASRTTLVVGGLLHQGARHLKAYLDDGILPDPTLDPRLGVPLIELEHTDTRIWVTAHFKQPDYVKWCQETLQGNAYMAYSWSAVLARVTVDPVTYVANCTDIWSVYDVGVPIDEKLLLGQIHGGVVQGIGYALLEHMTSSNGKIDQTSFSSYPIPTTMDIPKMHSDWQINRYVDGPFGAKAAGELTLVAVAPAVAAAVQDALGIEVNTLPITPEKIGGALHALPTQR